MVSCAQRRVCALANIRTVFVERRKRTLTARGVCCQFARNDAIGLSRRQNGVRIFCNRICWLGTCQQAVRAGKPKRNLRLALNARQRRPSGQPVLTQKVVVGHEGHSSGGKPTIDWHQPTLQTASLDDRSLPRRHRQQCRYALRRSLRRSRKRLT